MRIQMIPLYEKGNVLTEGMLEATKQYAMDFVSLSTDGYADGILKGCEVDVSDGIITVSRGLIRIGGQVYLIPQSSEITYHPVRQDTVLKLSLQDETRTQHFICREAELVLSENLAKGNAELELCRFKLQEGARLRKDYQNFSDYNTEFDTVNLLYADWAAYADKSICPEVLNAYVKEAMQQELSNPQDFLFCQQVLELRGGTLNRSTICFYMKCRLGADVSQADNLELYQKLKELLEIIKRERKDIEKQPVKRQRFVIS